MAIQTVKTGAAVNDGTGDDARTAFTKINQNFTDSTHAAGRLVGTAAGNVMGVGSFGIGVHEVGILPFTSNSNEGRNASAYLNGVIYRYGDDINALTMANSITWKSQIGMHPNIGGLLFRQISSAGIFGGWTSVYSTKNTSVDSNGFIKAASPIVKLFADNIELNDEAQLQQITFEKLGIGDYLVKGSTGFAQEGWYIETPKDANGNALVAVAYEQLANNDISVKTYAKMFDEETGDIVANTAKPRDIPSTRWIDLRVQALPQEDIQPLSTDETVATNAE